MTQPAGTSARTVPAGASDLSDNFGPTVEGTVVPRAVFHSGSGGYVAHTSMTGESSSAPPTSDGDRDNGLPDIPRYEGPSVPEQPALINPSAGDIGAPGGGVNPRGPDVYSPGELPQSVHGNAPFPDTAVGNR